LLLHAATAAAAAAAAAAAVVMMEKHGTKSGCQQAPLSSQLPVSHCLQQFLPFLTLRFLSLVKGKRVCYGAEEEEEEEGVGGVGGGAVHAAASPLEIQKHLPQLCSPVAAACDPVCPQCNAQAGQ